MATPCGAINFLSCCKSTRWEKGESSEEPSPEKETVLTNGFVKLELKFKSDLDDAIRQKNVTMIGKCYARISCVSNVDVGQVISVRSRDAESRVRMIQHVESLGAQLQLPVLPDLDRLEQAHVELVQPGTTQVVAR